MRPGARLRQLLPPSWRRLSLRQRRVFVSSLRVQLDAGLGPIEALRSFSRLGTPDLAELGERMAAGLDAGETMAQAAARCPELLTPHDCVLLGVGEESGTLTMLLRGMEEATLWLAELRGKTLGALIYPAILVNVAYLCANVMLVVDGAVLRYLGGWVGLNLMLSAALLGAGWALDRDRLRAVSDRLLLQTPGVDRLLGRALLYYHQAVLFSTFGLGLDGGIGLARALRLALEGARCEPLRTDLWAALDRLDRGSTLGQALGPCRFLSPAQKITIDTAELAGRLSVASGRLARAAREELEHWLRLYQRLLPVGLLLLTVAYVLERGM